MFVRIMSSAFMGIFRCWMCPPVYPFSQHFWLPVLQFNVFGFGSSCSKATENALPSYILAVNSQIAWQIIKKISNDSWAMWYEASRLISVQSYLFFVAVCGDLAIYIQINSSDLCDSRQLWINKWCMKSAIAYVFQRTVRLISCYQFPFEAT